ncbi:E3 ubiquitin-protein ligase RNF114 [Frankliniella fusca]|uniref:E3 ubiquitin-protein ligase RNF114 n=1 Tax=Frankliniella fusca TaxID=407009 RepID=A0AAE1GSV3_9NEOP|nr:E3 ubiquitin-protein ligase RNF114 [Frankliniella fusca]
MVFSCVCGNNSLSPEGLVEHLRLHHTSDAVINHYHCRQSPLCAGILFDNLKKFKDHLVRKHSGDVGGAPLGERIVADGDHIEEQVEQEVENEVLVADNQPVYFDTFAKAVYDSGLMFTAKLYNKDTIPRSAVQEIVSFTQDFMSGFASLLKRKVMDTFSQIDDLDEAVVQEIDDLKAMFGILESPFDELDTEAKRINCFLDANAYVKPEKYFIDSRPAPIQRRGVMYREMVPAYGQFVRMRTTLKLFLEMPDVFDKIMENVANLAAENEVISNFVQGELWAQISAPFQAEGKIVLPLFLFTDDYESNNGLGSHAGDDKVSAVYYKIPCIPKEFLSVLRCIFVAALFYANDRKAYGNKKVLEPLLQELEFLEREGILLHLIDRTVRVYFALGLILGDNLGLNAILGFVECFVANHFCRVCRIHRDELRFHLEDSNNLLRNEVNYNGDVGLANSYLTGIKEACIFNNLNSFHVTKNQCGDLLHEFEEGVCGYALPLILNWLINIRQYLTHEAFIERVSAFQYGPHESGNKPSTSKLGPERFTSAKFNLSGSESLCLTRYLGEMIGHLIPSEEPVWEYYLSLRDLADILYSPFFVPGAEILLRNKVREHNEMFVATFNEHLRPVHHFLLHYWRHIRSTGPLIHTSTNRYESKNREGKIVAYSTESRVNIIVTIMIKAQLKTAFQLLSKNIFDLKFVGGARSNSPARILPHFQTFSQTLNIEGNDVVSCLKFVEYAGTTYGIDSIVVYDVTENVPRFGKIVSIFVYNNSQLNFVLQDFDVLGFNNHFYAFAVEENANILCRHPAQLADHQPLWLRYGARDGAKFISTRHAF